MNYVAGLRSASHGPQFWDRGRYDRSHKSFWDRGRYDRSHKSFWNRGRCLSACTAQTGDRSYKWDWGKGLSWERRYSPRWLVMRNDIGRSDGDRQGWRKCSNAGALICHRRDGLRIAAGTTAPTRAFGIAAGACLRAPHRQATAPTNGIGKKAFRGSGDTRRDGSL